MKSQNSKPSPTSYQSSIAISRGQSEPKMQLSNTMQKPWMKSNPSLLQWLREEKLLETCWGPGETVMNQYSAEEPLPMALKLMNLSPSSAKNLRDLGSTLHELPLTMVLTPIALPTRNAEFSSQRCLGLPEKKRWDKAETRNARNHGGFSNYSLETTKLLNNGSKLPEPLPWVSQWASWITSSEDKPSTLMQCSPHCTTFQLLKRMLDAWELLKYPLVDQNPEGKLKWVASGQAPGMWPSKRLNSLSLTENKNSENMESILKGTFQPKLPPLIDTSSFTMLQSAMKLAEVRTPYSQTLIVSPGFTQLSSCQMGLNPNVVLSLQGNDHLERPAPKLKSAIVSTPLMVVGTPSTTVVSNMPAKDASAWAMGKNHVMSKKVLTHEFHPKYLRYNI